MRQRLLTIGTIFLFGLSLFLPAPAAFAQVGASDPDPLGVKYGRESGLSTVDPRQTAARIIQVALGLLGIITLVIIVYAGFLWLTSLGSEEKVEKARGMISAAVIGLVIILSAYALTEYVVRQLYKATTGYNYTP